MNFVSLCYHYIRNVSNNHYPRILGTSASDFCDQVNELTVQFPAISLQDIFSSWEAGEPHVYSEPRLLFTFDDGLKDHLMAGEILASKGISGVFFIPTCILMDGAPANPMIIHYGLAIHGLEAFLNCYRHALENYCLNVAKYDVEFQRGVTDPWEAIREIKQKIKYVLHSSEARNVLLFVYSELLRVGDEDILSKIHLSVKDVMMLVEMGHEIGTHSHTHLSVAASELSASKFDDEILKPRIYLEDLVDRSVSALSYPFGGAKDCYSADALKPDQTGYRCAFTVAPKLNLARSDRFSLGRFMPHSTDTVASLREVLTKMSNANGAPV